MHPVALLAIVLAALSGCKKDKDLPQAAVACIEAMTEGMNAIAEHGSLESADFACASMYLRTTCAEAWRSLRQSGNAAPAVNACAAAYCKDLPSKPKLCSENIEEVSADTIDAAVELDEAILHHELGNARVAKALARRLVFYERVMIPVPEKIDLPPGDTASNAKPVRLYFGSGTDILLDGKPISAEQLETHLPDIAASGAPVVVDFDEKLPYTKAVGAMDRLRQFGVKRISLATKK